MDDSPLVAAHTDQVRRQRIQKFLMPAVSLVASAAVSWLAGRATKALLARLSRR